jgi:2-methylcitrate dehydratase PrpD
MPSFTRELADRVAILSFGDLPEDVVELTKQCLLDTVGVALAGSSEPAASLLADELLEQFGDAHGATLVGRNQRLPMAEAALVNGTAAHALDYDDVNQGMMGHPSVPILPALLGLGEELHSTGRQVITAFVAGYETECCIGRALGVEHYQRGFHATGTVGTFGAAVACARLLELDADTTAAALGIAAAQGAGIKSMFGTMCKPLHAGKAATNGLLAARLAARRFTSAAGSLETAQGFAETHTNSFDVDRGLESPAREWHVRDNLFKYHAACFATHSSMEGLRRLRDQHELSASQVEAVTIHANAMQMSMCAIPEPATGLEAKFSLRQTAAMVLAGRDTAAVSSFDASVVDEEVTALRSRIVVVTDGPAVGPTPVDVLLGDGRQLSAAHDVSRPEADLVAQDAALSAKFRSLAQPVLGDERTETLLRGIHELENYGDIGVLMQLAVPDRVGVGAR